MILLHHVAPICSGNDWVSRNGFWNCLSNAMLKWVRLVPDLARTLLLHDFLNVEWDPMPPGQGSRFFKVTSCRFIIDPFEHLVVCQSLQNLVHIIIAQCIYRLPWGFSSTFQKTSVSLTFWDFPGYHVKNPLHFLKADKFQTFKIRVLVLCPSLENPRSIRNPRSSVSTRRYRQLHLHQRAGWSLNGCVTVQWSSWPFFFSPKNGQLFLWLTTCEKQKHKKNSVAKKTRAEFIYGDSV